MQTTKLQGTEAGDQLLEFEDQQTKRSSSIPVLTFCLTVLVFILLWANNQQRQVINQQQELLERIDSIIQKINHQ